MKTKWQNSLRQKILHSLKELCSFPLLATMGGVAAQGATVPRSGRAQASHVPVNSQRSHQETLDVTIEQAIQDYLEHQKNNHSRPKTLELHQQALRLFQYYLLTEHQCVLLGQLTETQVRGWLAFLPHMPTATGALRSSSTVESYARSARPFASGWCVTNTCQLHRLRICPFPK
jgi:hypothetical protein